MNTLYVNGETTALPHPTPTVAALLADLGYAPDAPGVAVAVNEDLVPRSQWPTHQLHPNDRVEVVTARQGG